MARRLLHIEPTQELVFTGPFTSVITSTIVLTNVSNQRVCFKIKTTVPKRYCVRPSSGTIEQGETREVAVMLQPFDYDASEKNKHKFMIQTMTAPDGEISNIEQIWKDADPAEIMDFKLKCLLRLPEGILRIDPTSQIVFQGPFDEPSRAIINFTNTSDKPMCFKIQTSALRHYSIDPSSAIVEPGAYSYAEITLQPFDFNPSENYRDRFMILSMQAPEDYQSKLETMWKAPENVVTEHILKCVFLSPKTVTVSKTVDNQALLSEITELRRENAELKESEMRLRRMTFSKTFAMSDKPPAQSILNYDHPTAFGLPPILYLIIIFFVALLIGKFLL